MNSDQKGSNEVMMYNNQIPPFSTYTPKYTTYTPEYTIYTPEYTIYTPEYTRPIFNKYANYQSYNNETRQIETPKNYHHK